MPRQKKKLVLKDNYESVDEFLTYLKVLKLRAHNGNYEAKTTILGQKLEIKATGLIIKKLLVDGTDHKTGENFVTVKAFNEYFKERLSN